MIRYEIRGASGQDEDALLELAGHLDTVNLPHDRDHVRRLLAHTCKSFDGSLEDLWKRKYVFLLWDLAERRAAGTSMIVAQLGRRDAPYIYFDVLEEEKYSKTTDIHFHHRMLRIGFSYKGPTEIGGLIVDPAYRRAPERLGLLISYVRFLFIAAHRDRFRKEILAELLPPLEPDGTSHLWEALGRRFTGMSYSEADRLSSESKDFIRDLFPLDLIYTTLLSHEAQDVIGKVGAQTRGVEKMLCRVGFKYANRVDPFDGGPHFRAPTEEITLVRNTVRRTADVATNPLRHQHALVGRDVEGPPYFRAVLCPFALEPDVVRLDAGVMKHLDLQAGHPVYVLPLP